MELGCGSRCGAICLPGAPAEQRSAGQRNRYADEFAIQHLLPAIMKTGGKSMFAWE